MTPDEHSPSPARVSPCPDEGQLAVWLDFPTPGRLAHLQACPLCRNRAAQLREEDAFGRRFAAALAPNLAPSPTLDLSARPLPELPEPPPDVPGYTIEGELARGGQGVVYRAVQHGTNRPAAVKALLRGALASERELARFEREVEIAASLRHPHIVAVFESRHLPDGRHVLVMELVEGVPLSAWDAPAGRDALPARVRLIRDAARAVQYAHGKGVIHRDLKPANILVDADGAPHILDFGLARRGPDPDDPTATPVRFADSSSHPWALTMHGAFEGTPAYAAPEQFENDRSLIDVRSDVYAMGVILHELLTGLAPFADSSGFEGVAERKRSRALTSTSSVVMGLRGVHADLAAVIAMATAVDRDARYGSAGDFADDLEAFLARRAVSARTDAIYRIRKFLRRRLLPLTVAVAAVSTLVAFLFQSAAHNRRLLDEQVRLRSLLQQVAIAGAAACARSDDRLGAERLLWSQLRDAPPITDFWLQALQSPGYERPLLWALLELNAPRPCAAIRAVPALSDFTRLGPDDLSVLSPDGFLQDYDLEFLGPLRPPTRAAPDGAVALPHCIFRDPTAQSERMLILEPHRLVCISLPDGALLGSLSREGLAAESPTGVAPDGASILLRGLDGVTRLHSLPDLAEILRFPKRDSAAARMAYARDSRSVLGLDLDAGVFTAFSIPDGRRIVPPFAWRSDYFPLVGTTPALFRFEFSPSGRAMAVCFGRDLVILERGGGLRCVGRDLTVGQNIAIRWSPSERSLITWSSGDSVPRLRDSASLAQIAAFHGLDGSLDRLAFSPDERCLLTIDGSGALRRWPLPGADWKTDIGPLTLGARQGINHATFDAAGALWAARNDGRILCLASPWKAPLRDFPSGMPNARGIDFLPGDAARPRRLVVAGWGDALEIRPADADGPAEPLPLPAPCDVFSMRVSPDGLLIAAGTSESLIRVWDAKTRDVVAERSFGNGRIRCLRWTPDSHNLVAAVGGDSVLLLDARTLSSLAATPSVSPIPRQIRSVAVSPPDPADPARFTLLTLGDDRVARLWAAPSMHLLGQDARADNDFFCSEFHPTAPIAVVGDRGGGVFILDARDGKILASFRAKPPVMTLSWSPDGRRLAVGGGDGSLEIWDFKILAEMVAANRAFWNPERTPP